jgi:xylulokinase
VSSVRQVMAQAGVEPRAVVAVGLTGQMHGLVLLDEQGILLRPAILWNDQRTASQCDEIRKRIGRQRLVHITGNDALTGFTAPKIMWVTEHEPALYAGVRHVLLPKDYIRYRLTGVCATDKADGSGTMLFDLAKRDWSPGVTRALGVSMEWLPSAHEGTEITGEVTAQAEGETGIPAGTPVVAGGGDQAAGAIGMGAIDPGVIAVTLGTSGVVFAPTTEPLFESEGRLQAFCHALRGRWHLMGVMLSAAGSLQWYKDTLAPAASFGGLMDEAAVTPQGSAGLLFLPYLTGERTPYPDPLARGAWVGLTARHHRGHLTRALLEGVAFGLKDSFELLGGMGLGAVKQVRIAGGGAKSALWRQILADVLGVKLVTVSTTEGAALGAALLAGVGVGAWPDVAAACAQVVKLGPVAVEPDNEHKTIYEQTYAQYRALYAALRPINSALSDLEK